ncbi:MAG: helix-turn-helix transcriptional regulator [Candidatus Daviesbacteria bacterium]|nr:helix-turn-helix transcriptional regulator [Candidatus Daviesbacteria bacterium]
MKNKIDFLLKDRPIFTLDDHLKILLKNPKFKKEWEDSEAEYQLACKLIEARLKNKMSQRDLAEKVHTSQAAISRIEGMYGNPSLDLLKRIAVALNSKLQISFS